MPGSSQPLPFTARLGGDPPHEAGQATPETDELIAPGDIYATVKGPHLALAIEFIRRDGSSFTVPYSYLPLLWWQPASCLIVEYPGLFSVRLVGKELDELHRRIRDQRLIWVREFGERQAAALASAVTRIDILRSYPSRDAGDDVSQDREIRRVAAACRAKHGSPRMPLHNPGPVTRHARRKAMASDSSPCLRYGWRFPRNTQDFPHRKGTSLMPFPQGEGNCTGQEEGRRLSVAPPCERQVILAMPR